MATTEVTIKTTKDRLVQIVEAEPKKYRQAELGRTLGVSKQRIHDLVKRLGLNDLVRAKHWSFYCLDCGKPIHSGSTRCRQCSRAKRVTLTCDFCGKQFERKESQARRYKRHFCSTNCRNSYRAKIEWFPNGYKSARAVKSLPLVPQTKLRTRVFELYNEDYLSLAQLAQAMGISNSEIYRVRDGKRPINEKFIIGAIKAFPGYRLGDLFYVAPYGSDDNHANHNR